MIELFSTWFLVEGNGHRHFHIRFVIGIIVHNPMVGPAAGSEAPWFYVV
jgi:hypothetical protein